MFLQLTGSYFGRFSSLFAWFRLHYCERCHMPREAGIHNASRFSFLEISTWKLAEFGSCVAYVLQSFEKNTSWSWIKRQGNWQLRQTCLYLHALDTKPGSTWTSAVIIQDLKPKRKAQILKRKKRNDFIYNIGRLSYKPCTQNVFGCGINFRVSRKDLTKLFFPRVILSIAITTLEFLHNENLEEALCLSAVQLDEFGEQCRCRATTAFHVFAGNAFQI